MNDVTNIIARFPVVPLVAEEDLPAVMNEVTAIRPGWATAIPNNVLALAHSPELAVATRKFLNAVWDIGSLGKELRILLRMKVSNANACQYCSTHQLAQIRRMGVAAAKLEGLGDPERSPAFDEREKAALAYALQLTFDPSNIDDALARRMQDNFSPQEIVEIATIVAAMGLLNRLNDGLRVPLEDDALEFAGDAKV